MCHLAATIVAWVAFHRPRSPSVGSPFGSPNPAVWQAWRLHTYNHAASRVISELGDTGTPERPGPARPQPTGSENHTDMPALRPCYGTDAAHQMGAVRSWSGRSASALN